MTDFSKILDKAKELEAKMKESQAKIKNINLLNLRLLMGVFNIDVL